MQRLGKKKKKKRQPDIHWLKKQTQGPASKRLQCCDFENKGLGTPSAIFYPGLLNPFCQTIYIYKAFNHVLFFFPFPTFPPPTPPPLSLSFLQRVRFRLTLLLHLFASAYFAVNFSWPLRIYGFQERQKVGWGGELSQAFCKEVW